MYVIKRFLSVIPRIPIVRLPCYQEGIPTLPRPFDNDGEYLDYTDAEWQLYLDAYKEYLERTKESEPERGGCK
jgi:hypothetical protein